MRSLKSLKMRSDWAEQMVAAVSCVEGIHCAGSNSRGVWTPVATNQLSKNIHAGVQQEACVLGLMSGLECVCALLSLSSPCLVSALPVTAWCCLSSTWNQPLCSQHALLQETIIHEGQHT
jgi:hypothetical protein